MQYKSGLDCYRKLVEAHGVKILYRGLTAQLIRVVPNSALQFWSFELIKTLLNVSSKG